MKLYLREFIKNNVLRQIDYYHASVNVTWKCNAKCPTCGAWKREPLMMSKNHAEILLEYPFKKMTITGGESTFWKHLVWFVNSGNWETHVLTNGINPLQIFNKAKQFKRKVLWHVSFNGLGDTHSKSKGINKGFNNVIATIRGLKNIGHDVICGFTPFAENISEYWDARKFLRDEFDINLGISFPSRCSIFGENNIWQLPEEKELYEFYQKFINANHGLFKWALQYFLDHVKDRKYMFCNAGLSYTSILPDGTITPCSYRDDSVGHIETGIDREKLKSIWRGDCLYKDDWICGDCALVNSIRRNVPKLLLWKLIQL